MPKGIRLHVIRLLQHELCNLGKNERMTLYASDAKIYTPVDRDTYAVLFLFFSSLQIQLVASICFARSISLSHTHTMSSKNQTP